MPRLELNFQARVGGIPDAEKLEQVLQRIRQLEGVSNTDIQLMESLLRGAADAGQNLATVLERTARGVGAGTAGVQNAAKQIVAAYKTEAEAAKDYARAGAEAEKEIAQKMREATQQIEAEFRQREALQRRFERVPGVLGGRLGGLAVGQTVGLPGAGFIGSQLAGSLGLTPGVALGVGIAGAGLFAADRVAKEVDNLGKWAQAQRNAANELGVTVTQMETLTLVGEQTGLKIDGVATSASKLSEELLKGGQHGREVEAALQELGLSTATAFKDPMAAVDDVAKALAQVQDKTERVTLATKLLGESGKEIAGIADQWEKAKERTRGGIIDPVSMQQLDEAHASFKRLGADLEVLAAKFAKPVNIVVDRIINTVERVNTGSQGAAITAGPNTPSWLRPFLPKRVLGASDSWDLTEEERRDKENQDAQARAARFQQVQGLISSSETPRERLERQLRQAESDREAAAGAFVQTSGSSPADMNRRAEELQKIKDADAAILKLRQQLEGLKVTAESFAEALARFSNRGDESSFTRRLAENDEQAAALRRRFLGTGPEAPRTPRERTQRANEIDRQSAANVDQIVKEAMEQSNKLMQRLLDEGRKEVEEFYNRQVQQIERGKRVSGFETPAQQVPSSVLAELAGLPGASSISVGQLAEFYKTGKVDFAQQVRGISDQSKEQVDRLTLGREVETGILERRKIQGVGNDTDALQEQLQFILQRAAIQIGALNQQAQLYRTRAASSFGTDREELISKAEEAEARAKQQEIDATTQVVQALNKFAESAEQASAKIRDEFGSFASGIVDAARHGRAGDFGRSFVNREFDTVVGNFAKQIYQPGMLEIPGQRDSQGNSTFLGQLLKGTLFQYDPKRHEPSLATDPGAAATALNTTATDVNSARLLDLTTAVSALFQALGGDPSSLPSSSGVSASIPGVASGVVGDVAAAARAFGVQVPGLTRSGGAFETGAGASSSGVGGFFTQILRNFGVLPSGSNTPGVGSIDRMANADWLSNPIAPPPAVTPLAIPGVTYSGGAFESGESYGTASSYPAIVTGSGEAGVESMGTPGAGGGNGDFGGETTSPALAKSETLPGAASSTAAAAAKALSVPGLGSPSAVFGSPNGAFGQVLGGVAAAGTVAAGVSGAISGIKQGGAYGGLGAASSILGTAAALDPEPISKGALALAALGTKLFQTFLGDPRQRRQNQITGELQNDRFDRPDAVNVAIDSAGNAVGTDYMGNVQKLGGAPRVQFYNQAVGFNQVPGYQNQVITQLNGYVGVAPPGTPPTVAPPTGGANFNPIPGAASGSGQSAAVGTSGTVATSSGAAVAQADFNSSERYMPSYVPKSQSGAPSSSEHHYHIHMPPIQTIDGKSWIDHSDEIGNAMMNVLRSNHPFNNELDRQLNPA